jgi:hypothetical protein
MFEVNKPMSSTKSTSVSGVPTAAETKRDSLTVTDNRTGLQYEIPIKDGAIRAIDLRQIKHDDDFGLLTAIKGSCSTAVMRLRIWRRKAHIPRLPTCFSTVIYRQKPSSPIGTTRSSTIHSSMKASRNFSMDFTTMLIPWGC